MKMLWKVEKGRIKMWRKVEKEGDKNGEESKRRK